MPTSSQFVGGQCRVVGTEDQVDLVCLVSPGHAGRCHHPTPACTLPGAREGLHCCRCIRSTRRLAQGCRSEGISTIGLDSTCGGTDAMPKRGGQPEHARSWRAAKKRHCITGKERIEDGSRLRSSGHGEAGVRGGQSGDLYVVVHVRPHDIFSRHGDDLLCEVPISFPTAALGGEIEVTTLNGAARLKIPPGTQSAHALPSPR